MTNAHVVAGVDEPQVEVGRAQLAGQGRAVRPGHATSRSSPSPGSARTPLRFARRAGRRRATDAIVVGYPQDGPYTATAARVRDSQDGPRPEHLRQPAGRREIYALRARVRPGNCGGPLLDTAGRVSAWCSPRPPTTRRSATRSRSTEVSDEAAEGLAASERVDTQGCA